MGRQQCRHCCHFTVQNSRICLLRANTADQMLDTVMPAFPKLGVKIDDVVVANFAMWHNT